MMFRRSRIKGEIDQETRNHLDMAAEAFLQDVRYGLLTLRTNPGFTVVAVAMLALGIGINAAVFTVINTALFEGFPLVHRNDRIVEITTTKDAIYYPDFEDWRAQATSFEGMALVRGVFHTLSDNTGAPETYFTTEVTANTFQLLGVKPILGRDFSPSDQQPGAESVVILRYEVWVRRFGANPALVGQTVRIDGLPASVIGVMPQGFAFPADQDLWTPLVPSSAAMRRDTFYARYAFARMADGVTIENARAEMETIGRRLASAYPGTNQGIAPVVRSFEEWFIGANATTLYKGMWGAVGFVLLIICANVANLLLERAIGRSREISIRLALGAGRWRIIRQFLAESLMLSILGGVIG
jgi:putative ABC transport system permease protein